MNQIKIVCRMTQQRVRNFRKKWNEFYGNHCAYCTADCSNDSTIDHIVPRSKGGRNSQDNLVMACRECNELKADKLIKDFRPLMLQPLQIELINKGNNNVKL